MRKEKGFTLIELIMVIVILGILAAVAIPRFVDLSSQAEASACAGFRGAIASASSIYYAHSATEGTPVFPPDTTAVGGAMADGVWPACPGAGSLSYDSDTGLATCDTHS